MNKDLIIDPDLHEYNLHELDSYIYSRIDSIKSEKEVDAYNEFTFLLSYSNRIGLKGNHLSLIKSELFKLLRIQLEFPALIKNKDFLISELEKRRITIQKDITLFLEEGMKKEEPGIYILEAFFPFKEKSLSIHVLAKCYYDAALTVRENYGEFHLRHPEDFKLIRDQNVLNEDTNSKIISCVESKRDLMNNEPEEDYEIFLKSFNPSLETILSKNA